ncbi:MAG: NUDIX hydrolase [Alphaproteobacteria bacterium]
MDYNSEIKGVKGIIKSSNNPDKYLLAMHNNTSIENKGKWTFLGGRIEETDQSYEDTLQRELIEELNLHLKIEREIGIFEYKQKSRIYMVMSALALNDPSIVSNEILKIDWFSYDEMIEMHNKSLLQTEFEIMAIEKCNSLL